MRGTFNAHAQATASIGTKNKISLTACKDGILTGAWTVRRIDAFYLGGHIQRIF